MSEQSEPKARFLRACRRLPVDRTPIWFMRQAGRYMAEYRAIRAEHSLLDICHQPELAAEVTMQPVNAFDVDAAIIFADILLPLVPMGADLAYVKGEGPAISNPVRTKSDVAALKPAEARQSLGFVMEAIRLVREQLPEGVPLIGFAGAPFTVGSYLIEGGSSRSHVHAKGFMYSQENTWNALMDKLVDVTIDYLLAQVEAGAQVIQLFDSWVGELHPDDYRRYVQPHSARVLSAIGETGVPTIHFGTGTATILPDMKEAGGTVIGVDWRTPLDQAWELLGDDVAVQGNMDPTALFADPDILEQHVDRVLAAAAGRPGHIFNLGHGILPKTPVENVGAVVDMVHAKTARVEG
ncbi:MAG: uroporphyrinogen decarboxylase [Anaerolineales bacterium]|nr:uroporphyrinogen decarboxylase [Anaerolineales bacterium]